MKYLKKILIIILLILTIGCTITNEKLTTDYYSYINGRDIENHELGEDEFYWGRIEELQNDIDKKTDTIITNIINDGNNQNLNILYNELVDLDIRNNRGISDLTDYINLIDNSNTIMEFIDNAIYIERELSIPIFLNLDVSKDLTNNTKNILYLEPIPFDFGTNSDIFRDEDYQQMKTLVKQYGIKLLKLYGYDSKKAREISKNLMDYYEGIAAKSKSYNTFTDVSKIYNVITREELEKIYSNLPSTYFDFIKDDYKLSILDKGNYEAINEALTNENLTVLKETIKLKILENYACFLSRDYLTVMNDLSNEQLGIKKDLDINREAYNVIKSYFGYDIDEKYDSVYLTGDAKKYIENMINDILANYEKNLSKVTWLSGNTKREAINKLKNIKVNIGMNSNTINYSLDYNLSSSNSLVENVIKMNKAIFRNSLRRLENDKDVTVINETTFNAYYNLLDNSINFPAACLSIIDLEDNYYKNLGSIGMVIAHEVTHAFDSNGSKFDKFGNLDNWWSSEDIKSYENLRNDVIKYYNKYEVVNGKYIDGELTVNENIADLGAISCISSIAATKKASDDEIKTMYESFAKFYLEKSTEQYQKLLLDNDTHSPSKYRVNATLASTDLFYKVYNVPKNNEMYLKENERIKIW